MKLFLDMGRDRCAAILGASDADFIPELKAACHAMRGSADQLGALVLGAQMLEIEQQLAIDAAGVSRDRLIAAQRELERCRVWFSARGWID
ncbi:MAG: hypothetical protein K2X99_05755 [Gemmatimonadaceae bacterium]|nr:hypothetical protein [Gemmatimonadaceae bacterium]